MVFIFRLLLLVLLNILFQRFLIYCLQRLTSHHYSNLNFSNTDLLYFLSFGSKCTHFNKPERKKLISLKRKGSNLLIPAKLHASIKNTNSERTKSTMQNIRLENKALKSKTEQIKFEFENKSIGAKDNSLHRDFVKHFSNYDTSKMPRIIKFFPNEQQKVIPSSKTGV